MSSILAKWDPVTHDFGLIRAPLDQVLGEFKKWHQSIGLEFSRFEITSNLDDAFGSLLPHSASRLKSLFVATHSDWVAYFQNGIQGSDPSPKMSYLAAKMEVLSMRVCCTANSAVYPAVIWEVFAPQSLGGEPPLNCRRSICAANDSGRWVFEEFGEYYPFEQTERYIEKRKRDRFTCDMIRDYLREFGVELFSDDFLRVDAASPAVRLQRTSKLWAAPEFTLEEVVGGAPWRRVHKQGR